MSSLHEDRNLLFVVLALQNELVPKQALLEAMNSWGLAKHRALGDILVEAQVLLPEDRRLLDALVDRQIALHGSLENSLATMDISSSARLTLGQMQEPRLHDRLSTLTSRADAEATCSWTAGEIRTERYRILRPHAKGGLGEVFVAEDLELHREVALKEIRHEHATVEFSRGRFLLEAEITGSLEHPGIVPVYGLGTYDDGRPFYAMRFIRGDNLKTAIRQFHEGATKTSQTDAREAATRSVRFDSLAFRQLLGRFIDVCNVMAYAHSRGVLHRDLKPGNIMLGRYGETIVVDWGLAKVVGRSETTEPPADREVEATLHPHSGSNIAATQLGSAIGTPAYMSPEQAAGRIGELSPATDVYSLGATLYNVLTNQIPFPGGDSAEVLQRVQRGDFKSPRQTIPAVPAALDAVCRKAMALKPQDRHLTPAELADDLERWLADEPVSCHRDSIAVRTARWGRKHRLLVVGGASVSAMSLLALVIGLLMVSGYNRRLEKSNSALASANQQLDATNSQLTTANSQLKSANKDLDLSRSDAEQKRQAAEESREQAELISEFLVKAFRLADPVHDGRTLTVAAALTQAVKELDQKPEIDPVRRAALLHAIGNSYSGLGMTAEAVAAYEQVVALRRAALPPEDPLTLASMNNLALTYANAGLLDKALPLHIETLERTRKVRGENHLDTLTAMNSLAVAYQLTGQLDKAVPLYEDTVKRMRVHLGEDDEGTLTAMHTLAVAYDAAGILDKGLPLHEETHRRTVAKFGPDHPDSLLALSGLASGYNYVGQMDKAATHYEEALRRMSARLGEDHPHTLAIMSNLGLAYDALGQAEKSLPLLEKALQKTEAKLGEDHPNTLSLRNNVALGFRSAGRSEESIRLFERNLELRRKKLGEDHPDTLSSMGHLAVMYFSSKQFDKAVPLFEQTNRQQQEKLGADHPDVIRGMNNLAMAYNAAGQRDKALPLFEQTLRLMESKLGVSHLNTLMAMYNLGRFHRDAGRFDEAAKLLRDCLARGQSARPEDWWTFETQVALGIVLREQKQFDEAERMMLAGQAGLAAHVDTIPPVERNRVRIAAENIAKLYDAWEKPDQAAEWRKKVESLGKNQQ